VAVYRNIALPTGTHQGSGQLDFLRVIDVVKIDAVVVADKDMVATEG
jgi:hypothetical protein